MEENISIPADPVEPVWLQLRIPRVRERYCGIYSSHSRGSPWQNGSAWLRLFGKLLSFMHTLSLIKRALLNRSKDLMTVSCIYRSLVQGYIFKWE